MSKRTIHFSRRADADLDRLEAFLASESRGRAERAIDRLNHGMGLLASFPELGVSVGQGFRQVTFRYRTGGYIVRYRVIGEVILVTRLWHTKEMREG